MSFMIRLCKDCVYCDISALCYHNKGIGISLVTGKKVYPYCSIERSAIWPFDVLFNVCGKRGRWWIKAA